MSKIITINNWYSTNKMSVYQAELKAGKWVKTGNGTEVYQATPKNFEVTGGGIFLTYWKTAFPDSQVNMGGCAVEPGLDTMDIMFFVDSAPIVKDGLNNFVFWRAMPPFYSAVH